MKNVCVFCVVLVGGKVVRNDVSLFVVFGLNLLVSVF